MKTKIYRIVKHIKENGAIQYIPYEQVLFFFWLKLGFEYNLLREAENYIIQYHNLVAGNKKGKTTARIIVKEVELQKGQSYNEK